MVMLSVLGKGIIRLGLDAIESIQHGPEAVTGGPLSGT
jgi:hypothetical protein